MPMESRTFSPKSSSKKQPKTRPGTYALGGLVMTGSSIAVPEPLLKMLSTRSNMNGIQPIWLSENATLSCGNLASTPESNQSAIAIWLFMLVSAIWTLAGASRDVVLKPDDEPMCMQMTVPVSSHAANTGSQ